MSSSPSTLKSKPQQRRKPNQKHPGASPSSILRNGLIGSKNCVASVDRTHWPLREGSISFLFYYYFILIFYFTILYWFYFWSKEQERRPQQVTDHGGEALEFSLLDFSIHSFLPILQEISQQQQQSDWYLKFLGRGKRLSDQRTSGPKSQAKLSIAFVSLVPLPAWPQRQRQR